MNNSAQSIWAFKMSQWKRFLVLVPLTAVLVLGSYLYIKPKAGTYTVQTLYSYTDEELASAKVILSDDGVVEAGPATPIRMDESPVRISFRAIEDGTTDAEFIAGNKSEFWRLKVRKGAVIEGGINFEGWEAIQVSVLVFLGALVLLFMSGLNNLWRISWYGYTMVAMGGGLLFVLFQFSLFAFVFVWGASPGFSYYLYDLSGMAGWFSALLIYVMLPLSLAVSISNVSLIRHEGKRPVNLLGMAASAVWAIAYFHLLFPPYYIRMHGLVRLFYDLLPVAVSYGECLLLSTMLCAWLSTHYVPDHDVDYLVILGCGIRADGTPSPLLAGRVDRAVSFAEARVAAGGKPVVFVPSGGKGPDEPMSEAQSMANYLMEQKGIPQERIVLEDRSTTTRENMAFSREVIERHAGHDASELRVAFATTNYHVFRGYVCAHQAGMFVEGMGAKTKWYFWPNAFLREFIGLLVWRWKDILVSFLAISGFYLFAAYVLSLATG